MILNGNQRGGAKDLALHLMKDENERVEVHELRGFMSSGLMGALNEAYAISRGTRCKQFLYSLSLNPPQDAEVSIAEFEAAIERAEKALNLSGQPRAIVFHEKYGHDGKLRRHAHVVWSRIDPDTMKARQISFDHDKLTELSRNLFLEHGWEMPRGLKERGERDPLNFSHAEHQQAQRAGKTARQIKQDIQTAWHQSDNKASLEQALSDKGYFLARGDRRSYVVIDLQSEVYSLPKQANVKTKVVRERLGDPALLPSVDDIHALLEKMPEHRRQENTQEKQRSSVSYSKEKALAHVSKYHAAFTRRMMDRSLKAVIPDKTQRLEIIKEIIDDNDLKTIGQHNGQDVYASQSMIDLEKQMLDTSYDLAKNQSHAVDQHAVHRAIYNLNHKLAREIDGTARLSSEQTETLKHITEAKQLSILVGVAGAGKTTILEGAKQAYEASGYRVVGAAPSGIAAAGLKDIGMNASTLHSLEARINLAQEMLDQNTGKALSPKQQAFIQNNLLTEKDILVVDETGMVSAPQMKRIMDLCQQSGAKLVLVGDPEQLQSVEAGTAFRNLLDHHPSAILNEVRRQKTDWQRQATIDLSQGRIAEAVSAYDQNACMTLRNSKKDTKKQLVNDLMQDRLENPDQSRLVLAYTRKDVTDLNKMIKAAMTKEGHISDKNIDILTSIPNGEDGIQEVQQFAVGDRILFRQNDRDIGVMNGSFGTLQEAEDNLLKVKLDDGKIISFSPKTYNAFQHGYAATVHKSQGMTVDEAYVLATPHFDRHTSYVALSRHKQNIKLYASETDFADKTQLHKAMGRDGDKLSTLDFVPHGHTKNIEQTKHEERFLKSSAIQKLRDEFMRNRRSITYDNPQHERNFSRILDM